MFFASFSVSSFRKNLTLIVVGLVVVSVVLTEGVQHTLLAQSFDPDAIHQLEGRTKAIRNKAAFLRKKKYEKMRAAKQMVRNISDNQRKLSRERESLHHYQSQLSNTKDHLNYLDARLDRTLGDTYRFQEQAADRLRVLYMGQRLSMLQMILEADDLSTLLDRMYYKQKIVSQDKALLMSLEKKARELNSLKQQLAQQKALIGQTVSSIRVKNMQIERSIAIDTQLKNKYQHDANFYARAEAQLLQESSRITAQIQSLMRSNSPAFNNVTTSTGQFMWPVRGPITSGFGSRFHPIRRRRIHHTGLDISAPNRSAIRAADGGTVIFAGWKGGYGQAIVINHGSKNGQNMVTLYGHLSGIAVGNGQSVSKGSVIGYEGSTGYSTGPHLHFEIRVNGVPVNPLRFL
jgi:murein DD-endopeptidase MepM/ murein hydrolase activator NlpD